MSYYYSIPTSSTSNMAQWWLYSPFSMYESSYVRHYPVSSKPIPQKEEISTITDEEFDAAFKDLLFSAQEEEENG